MNSFPDGALIVGPASAGIGLSQLVTDAAARLRPQGDYRAMYGDKAPSVGFTVERNVNFFKLPLPIVVTEDVLTTGGSVRSLVSAISRAAGRTPKAVYAICNRGVTAADLDIGDDGILGSFLYMNLPKYDEAECPLCVAGKPINMELGHGREFMAERGGQPPFTPR